MKILFFSLIALSTFSCAQNRNSADNTSEEGSTIENYDFSDQEISNLDIDGVFKVTVVQGTANKIHLETPKKLDGQVDVFVDDKTLVVKINGNFTSDGYKDLKGFPVEIEIKDIEKVVYSGVGSLTMDNIQVDSLTVESEMVGKISLSGEVDYLKMMNEGIGNVDAKELHAKEVDVSNEGIGKISVYATERLDINAEGIGKINYYGEPKIKNIRKEGLGKIKNQGMR